MSGDRGAEIERFYWVILNLLGKAFGYLMMVAGGTFALSFLAEYWRTGGEMYWDGKTLDSWSQQWPLVASGVGVALVGLIMVKMLPVKMDKSQD